MKQEVDILKQDSKTDFIKPVVRLVTSSINPVGTIVSVWHGSRNKLSLNPIIIQQLYDFPIFDEKWYKEGLLSLKNDPNYSTDLFDTAKELIRAFPDNTGESGIDFKNVIKEVFKSVLKYNIPPSEAIQFTFEIDCASVAWREQLVRGRLSQNFWTQSTRPMDLTTMDVSMNKSIELFGGEEGVKIYKDTVNMIRETYKRLTALGVPQEDIRLQPQMHTHRVYWFVSLRTLLTVISKRCDWIAQASLWTPIISGILKIIRDLGLYELIQDHIGKPICRIEYNKELKKYVVTDYPNLPDCEARYNGHDPAPVDPLYLAYANRTMPSHTDFEFYDYMKSMYINIWSDEVLSILGWDRSNPSKLGYYDRPTKGDK